MSKDFINHVSFGSHVQVTSKKNKNLKYMCSLVGIDNPNTIITALPTPKQLRKETPDYTELFAVGHPLVMRTVVDGSIFGFETEVLDIFYKRSKLLISTYPKKIQSRSLRKEARYNSTLFCSIERGANEKPWPGIITNISQHGCKLHITDKLALTTIEELKVKGDNLAMQVVFPYGDGMQTIKGVVRSVNEGNKKDYIVGISFTVGIAQIRRYFELLELEGMLNILGDN